MSNIPEGLLFSESHEWVSVYDGVATIGVSDFAQAEMGDITYVELPSEGDVLAAGDEFGALESVKASSELYCPVSGTVIEVNEALESSPEIVNSDPYGAWMIKVRLSDESELSSLLSAEAYAEIAR